MLNGCSISDLSNETQQSRRKGGPLDRKGSHEHVEPNASIAIAMKKGHQKPKPNKDHHMNILENYRKL